MAVEYPLNCVNPIHELIQDEASMKVRQFNLELHLPSRFFLGWTSLLFLDGNLSSSRCPSKWGFIVILTIIISIFMDIQLVPCHSFGQGSCLPPYASLELQSQDVSWAVALAPLLVYLESLFLALELTS